MFDLEAWSKPRRNDIESWFTHRYDNCWPPAFGKAMDYPLQTGGKRVRPLLAIASYEAVTGKPYTADILAPAAAVELVHTYSLVHDDLPAMDDDDVRRGKPTVHRAFGEAEAILVGDALLTDAFAALAESNFDAETRISLVQILSHASGHLGMVGGQAADIGMNGDIDNVDDLTHLHRLKTGALLKASVLLGATAANADPNVLQALSTYGQAVGLAFQLIDDLLDEEQDGGDSDEPSFVRLLGADETRRRAEELSRSAHDCIAMLSDNASQALHAIADFIVHRKI